MSYVTHQPVFIKRSSVGGLQSSSYAPMAPIYNDVPQMRYVMNTPLRYRPVQDIRGAEPGHVLPIHKRQQQSRFMTATSIPSNPLRRQNIVPMYQQHAAPVQPQLDSQMIMMIPNGGNGQQLQIPGPQNIERIQMNENPYHLVPYGSSPHHSATCNIL